MPLAALYSVIDVNVETHRMRLYKNIEFPM